jgi:hypothetical protein
MLRIAFGLCIGVASFASIAIAGDLDAVARRETVAKLAEALEQRYVYPDVGATVASRLKTTLDAGGYDRIDDPAAFANRLTADMNAVAHDKHLKVVLVDAPRAPVGPPPPHSEAGVVRADRLPGGIGYVEVSSFPPPDRFKPVIDKAMSALSGSKALVIDVRRNTGGSPASVAYLVSFALPSATRVHVNDVVARTPSTLEFTRKVFESEPTPVSFAGTPIYVLTSKTTFSGGEEFAYDVQSLKAGVVVGEITGGGANPTGAVPLGAKLMAQIPWGRAENPVTKTNWEGVGVRPAIATPAAEALALVLRRLGQDGVTDVAAASQARVFTPRSVPVPGSEQALRRVLGAVMHDDASEEYMTPQAIGRLRRNSASLKESLSGMGEVRALVFRQANEFGADDYDVTFEHGALRCAIALTPDGRVDVWAILGPPPT